jgi:hypothetical protein
MDPVRRARLASERGMGRPDLREARADETLQSALEPSVAAGTPGNEQRSSRERPRVQHRGE